MRQYMRQKILRWPVTQWQNNEICDYHKSHECRHWHYQQSYKSALSSLSLINHLKASCSWKCLWQEFPVWYPCSTEICPPCFKNKVLWLCTDLCSVLQLHVDIKAQMLLTVIVPIPKCWVARRHTTKKKKKSSTIPRYNDWLFFHKIVKLRFSIGRALAYV